MTKLRAIVFAPLLCCALCGSEFKPPNFVYVKTVNHVVYMTGQVNTDLVRENAESIVRDAADGTRVVNSIALTYP